MGLLDSKIDWWWCVSKQISNSCLLSTTEWGFGQDLRANLSNYLQKCTCLLPGGLLSCPSVEAPVFSAVSTLHVWFRNLFVLISRILLAAFSAVLEPFPFVFTYVWVARCFSGHSFAGSFLLLKPYWSPCYSSDMPVVLILEDLIYFHLRALALTFPSSWLFAPSHL